MHRRVALALAFALFPAAGLAQHLSPGAPVRATYRAETDIGTRTLTIEGAYLDRDPTSLRLSLGAHSSRSLDVPLDRLIRLEVGDGRSAGRGAGRGALWGGLSGALFGLAANAVYCTEDGHYCTGGDVAISTLFTTGVGAGAGALIGAVIGVREWREVVVVQPPGDR